MHVCWQAGLELMECCRPTPRASTHLHRGALQVEARAPLLTVQLADARAALSGDLAISEERATALRARDPDSLSLDDAARLAVHDALHVGRARGPPRHG